MMDLGLMASWRRPLGLFVVFLLSLSLFPLFQYWAIKKGLWDTPNARSAHFVKTPRGAGLVFVLIWLLVSGLSYFSDELDLSGFAGIGLMPVMMAALGFWDDRVGLSARFRLLTQVSLAILTLLWLYPTLSMTLSEENGVNLWITLLGALLLLVWSLNSYNFMDGMDGLAGLQGAFISVAFGWFYFISDAGDLANLCWCLTVSLLAFLFWNRPKARLFMGDVGSTFLGFLFCLLAYSGESFFKNATILYGILHAVFWVDATLTLLYRFFCGKSLFHAHQDHAYQRLFKAGYPVTTLLWGLIVINLMLFGIANAVYFSEISAYLGLSLALILLAGLYVAIIYLTRAGEVTSISTQKDVVLYEAPD